MINLKKLGALTGASALVGSGLVAVAGSLAFAAPVTASWNSEYYLPGETATLTLGGCEAGGTVLVGMPEENTAREIPVGADGTIPVQTFEIPDDVAGELGAEVRCQPAEGSDEAPTETTAEAYILGKQIKAVPDSWTAGDTVEITAGEFVPGSKVTLRVNNEANTRTLWAHEMGTANDDKLAVDSLVFPTTLECGTYNVEVSSLGAVKDNSVTVELYMCGTPTPSPSASPSASASASPSATATPTPTKTSKPGKPGLPSTGV